MRAGWARGRRLGHALAALATPWAAHAAGCTGQVSICTHATPAGFALISDGRPAAVLVDASADPAVRDAARNFATDLAQVAGSTATPLLAAPPAQGPVVLIGVLGHSPLIDRLVAEHRIAAADVAGKWEAFRQIVVENPFPGVARALVVVGADRRGAVFGTYDMSERMGVSPWSWWADVPVRRQRALFLTAGSRFDAPKVRYRGFFINDEEPAFGTWARAKFGGINARAYAHVFDLALRLKANFLWPAMWGKAFAADDPQNMVLADAKGIVMGTSHHEPMMRAQEEWHRPDAGSVTGGKWDYTVNAANLRAFWRGGIARMMSKGDGASYDSVVTIGMRGDGDEPMSEGTATGLLERIVADQRRIIADVTGRPADRTPQVWALYKEVQDYYDHGMSVPDDVTLLFSDDNWGQIRRLPTANLDRRGGYGVYYHYDYVGGPRDYKWINTNQIEKTWQQMDLAYQRGARALWIVNVGDLKPMEFPLDFFLKMAWNPEAMTPAALAAFPRTWASRTFGPALGPAIGDLVSDYARLAARRKPELIDADSFPLGGVAPATLDGGEFGAMVAAWDDLSRRMEAVRDRLSPDQRDAYFQLVEHPILALGNLYHLYYTVAWNRRLAPLRDPRANLFADQAEAAFRRDGALRDAYHRLNGGKWDGMMLQTHIGYVTWSDPKVDVMPAVSRVPVTAGAPAPALTFRTAAPPARPTWAAVEAPRFTRAVGGQGLAWTTIPRLGRTEGAVSAFPQGRPATSTADGVRVEYALSLPQGGDARVRLYMVPTLDTRGQGGIRIGVSVDDRPVQVLTMNLIPDAPDWTQAVKDNAFPLEAAFPGLSPGRHVVKVWRIDDNALVQKVVLYTGTLPQTYLGPVPAA